MEKAIPGARWEGWYVRSDGSVRKPSARKRNHIVKVTFGCPTVTGHCRVTNGCHWDGRVAHFWIHRLVAHAFVHNPRPDIFVEVDHIDGNPKNNDFLNLRWLTHQLNCMNNRGQCAYYNKKYKTWKVVVRVQGKRKRLGYFRDEHCAKAVALDFKDREFRRIYDGYLNEVEKRTRRPCLVWSR